MKKKVGVDIGATQVRVVEVSGVDAAGKAIITRIGLAPINPGAIVAGRIKSPEQVALSLKLALKDAGVSKRGFIIGVASPDVAIDILPLPASIKPEDRQAVIRNTPGYEISPNVPLNEAVIATQTIATEVVDGNQEVTLNVAAVLQSEIEAIKSVCQMAGAQPRAIDLSGAATVRALTRVQPDVDEVVTIVDIGASKITVATRTNEHMSSLRSAAGGGIDITRSLKESLDLKDDEEAEKLKLSLDLDAVIADPDEEDYSQRYSFEEKVVSEEERRAALAIRTLSSTVDSLVETIALSVETEANNTQNFAQGVLICGGTARLRGLKKRLQNRLGIRVMITEPMLRIEHSPRNEAYFVAADRTNDLNHLNMKKNSAAEKREDPALAMDLTVAIGLALWEEDV